MIVWASGDYLFYGGIAIMAAAIIIGTGAAAALRVSGKRLRERLEAEFGKKRC